MTLPSCRLWPLISMPALLMSRSIFAHGTISKQQNVWTAWVYTPEITIPLLLVCAIYLSGMLRRHRLQKPAQPYRAAVFFLAMAFFYIAMQSPLEPLSDHYFFMHQIEHLILRMAAPLVLILSMPGAVLIQGLPGFIRRLLLKPILKNRLIYRLYRLFSQPLLATVLFIATLYIWQIPQFHELAILNQGIHDFMHFSMLLTAFFFWWVIADPRRKAARCGYGIRLFLLWGVTTFNSILGAVISLTRSVIYQVYDQGIDAIQMTAMEDQQYGGVTLWVPGGMMGVIGTGVVFLLWLRESKYNQRVSARYSPSNSEK